MHYFCQSILQQQKVNSQLVNYGQAELFPHLTKSCTADFSLHRHVTLNAPQAPDTNRVMKSGSNPPETQPVYWKFHWQILAETRMSNRETSGDTQLPCLKSVYKARRLSHCSLIYLFTALPKKNLTLRSFSRSASSVRPTAVPLSSAVPAAN